MQNVQLSKGKHHDRAREGPEACSVVYGGEMSFATERGSVVAFRDLQF